MTYTLTLDQTSHEGLDDQAMISLEISKSNPPTFLSDFIGGKATFSSGGMARDIDYSIIGGSTKCRVILSAPQQEKIILSSPWKRTTDNSEPHETSLKERDVVQFRFERTPASLSKEYSIRCITNT